MIGIGPSLASFLMVAGPVLGAVGIVVLAPVLWLPLLMVAAACGVLLLVLRHTMVFVVAWLLITGATIEMALLDLIGPAAFQATIAVVKAAGIALAGVCALRWGGRLDPLNPAWAFLAMAVAGLAVGTHPDLPVTDNMRSLLGSLAPFAFCFCRLRRDRAETLLAAIRWCPVIAVAAGVALALVGVRPLFVDSGGLRLAGIGHPAFLAGVALVGIHACLIAMFRRDHGVDRWLLAGNLVILLLTGARAPLAYAVAVILLSLAFVRTDAFPPIRRGLLIVAAACAVPLVIAMAGDLSNVRVFHLLTTDAAHLSGRDRLWPLFEAAAEGAPWFGWGIGAGNIVIPPGSAVAKLLRTWAAHNEYLRLRVEGGWIGLGLLIAMFTAWVIVRTAGLAHSDRWIMRFVFLAFAAHAITDNVLISTPACVLFTFAAAVFASAERRS
jgi:hypothetical protein